MQQRSAQTKQETLQLHVTRPKPLKCLAPELNTLITPIQSKQ